MGKQWQQLAAKQLEEMVGVNSILYPPIVHLRLCRAVRVRQFHLLLLCQANGVAFSCLAT